LMITEKFSLLNCINANTVVMKPIRKKKFGVGSVKKRGGLTLFPKEVSHFKQPERVVSGG